MSQVKSRSYLILSRSYLILSDNDSTIVGLTGTINNIIPLKESNFMLCLTESYPLIGSFAVQRKEGVFGMFKTFIRKQPTDETSQRTDAEGIILYKLQWQIFNPSEKYISSRAASGLLVIDDCAV